MQLRSEEAAAAVLDCQRAVSTPTIVLGDADEASNAEVPREEAIFLETRRLKKRKRKER
jgi:hypothetical protein